MSTTIEIAALGQLRSCFSQKFSIPRQPLLASAAKGYLDLCSRDFDYRAAVKGLEGVSHIWLIFAFHEHGSRRQESVRPPRLGGNKKLGVFATRSSFRPNGLGLSVVRLEAVEPIEQGVRLQLSGLDLLDGTPIYDIKPYVPYADGLDNATNDLAQLQPELIEVEFTQQAQAFCRAYRHELCPDLALLLEQLLAQNPAPAYHKPDATQARQYGFRLLDCEVSWSLMLDSERALRARVESIAKACD